MLDSVISQTYSNWEILLVDDHSSDNSFQIVSEYCKRDSRVKLFKNSGQGIISGLRTAYSHAKGTYVTRMDSDDIMESQKLEVLLNSLIRNGRGHIAIGQVQYFSEQGVGPGYKSYEDWLNRLTAKGENYLELYKECVIPSPCWMMHIADFDICGGFNADLYPEDYDLVFRFYKHDMRCIPCDQVLHQWRDYSSRTSRTHVNYADHTFIDLKLQYFLELHLDLNKSLVVWGAGKKGKRIANTLVEKNIAFTWVCDNPKKIGKQIYGQHLMHVNVLEDMNNAQNIVTVANPMAQREIKKFFTEKGKKSMIDYFFFC
ncbi:glycosyltransferase family 2 protein [bacterium SCSIO 12643]|nr:glycosyltransferase family 2 protein [bacterium SCSIO 12643]